MLKLNKKLRFLYIGFHLLVGNQNYYLAVVFGMYHLREGMAVDVQLDVRLQRFGLNT
jgi:hypothetical protein